MPIVTAPHRLFGTLCGASRSRREVRRVQVSERAQGEFSRQLFLGEGLDRDHVVAPYQDGELPITIPVAEQAMPRKVEIAHAGAGLSSRGALYPLYLDS